MLEALLFCLVIQTMAINVNAETLRLTSVPMTILNVYSFPLRLRVSALNFILF
mgnify:CR=1 FL=1